MHTQPPASSNQELESAESTTEIATEPTTEQFATAETATATNGASDDSPNFESESPAEIAPESSAADESAVDVATAEAPTEELPIVTFDSTEAETAQEPSAESAEAQIAAVSDDVSADVVATDSDTTAAVSDDVAEGAIETPAEAVSAEGVANDSEATVAVSDDVAEGAIESPAEAVSAEVVESSGETPPAADAEEVADGATETSAESGESAAGEPAEAAGGADAGVVAAAQLIADVQAAPHKVYLLGRVRKAITAADEGETADQLRAVEIEIQQQVTSRTAAKEALCERAETLQDSTAWKATGDAYKALFEEWKQVGAAGRELDDQLWARFNQARGAFNERRSKHFEEREQVWSGNREQKEALCVEAEALAESTEWKATADAMRDLQARWKAVGSAGREKDEALWGRFNAAKQVFFDHRTAAWEENRKQKEALVLDAEALKDSTDWRTAGDAIKVMQAQWKNIGPAGRENEDELWTRFRQATQSFFDRRGSTFAERNQTERDNLTKKQELCQRAEALAYTGDALSAAREAKELQAQWKETGPVPREQSEALWARFREACDKIFGNATGERDRQQNEWHIRMKEAMTRKREQLNSLRESIAHDEANIERWRETLSNLKPGGKSDEIGKGLEDKIIDVMGRIRDKQGRVEDLRSSINDIEAKLKE